MSISVSEEQQEKNTLKLPEYCYSSDFSVISESPAFVDKTLFIKKIFENRSHYSVIIAPPGYGKSTNLDMVKRFVEIDVDPKTGKVSTFDHSKNYKIFNKTNLKIHSHPEIFKLYFAEFPVIYLSLKNVYGKTWKEFLSKFAEKLSESFQQHFYLLNSHVLTKTQKLLLKTYLDMDKCKKLNECQLDCGILFLAKMLGKHYPCKSVFLFVDDYDYPGDHLSMEWNVYDESIPFWFHRLFNWISKAAHRLISYGLFVGRTSYGIVYTGFRHIPLLNVCLSDKPYSEFFYLTNDEIIDLLTRFDCFSPDNFLRITMCYSYTTCANEKLVCISSVIKYLNAKEFYDFRCPCEIFATNCLLQKYYKFSPARHLIDKLLNATCICALPWDETSDEELIEANYTLFIMYLTSYGFVNYFDHGSMRSLFIPNQFIVRSLKQSINDYYGRELNEKLVCCAKIFDSVSFQAPRQVFYNLIKEFRNVAVTYSSSNDIINANKTINTISIQCMADILAKTKFEYYMPIIRNDFGNELSVKCTHYHNNYNCNNTCGTPTTLKDTTMFIRVENGTPIQTILATLVEIHERLPANPILHQEIRAMADDEKLFVGMRTDEKFQFAIGWLIGTDLNKAQYIVPLFNN